MANSAPNSRKSKHDVAPWVRHNFHKAIRELVRRKGKPAHAIMADWLEEDPIAVLRVVAQFQERTSIVAGTVKHEHTRRIAEGDAASDEVVAGLVDAINRLAETRGAPGHAPTNGANGSGVPPVGNPESTRH